MRTTGRMAGMAAIAVVSCALAFGSVGVSGQGQAVSTQKQDAEYAKRILDNTPDKRILTELVDHLPVSATVPSPP